LDFVLRYLPEGDERQWFSAHREAVKLAYLPHYWALNSPNGAV